MSKVILFFAAFVCISHFSSVAKAAGNFDCESSSGSMSMTLGRSNVFINGVALPRKNGRLVYNGYQTAVLPSYQSGMVTIDLRNSDGSSNIFVCTPLIR